MVLAIIGLAVEVAQGCWDSVARRAESTKVPPAVTATD